MKRYNFKSELKIPVIYKGKELQCNFFCDFLVEDLIVVELKSISELNNIHRAQILNYINLMKKTQRNFNKF
nr:GxxExxY protein [Chryseobacterium sp. H1D6B]